MKAFRERSSGEQSAGSLRPEIHCGGLEGNLKRNDTIRQILTALFPDAVCEKTSRNGGEAARESLDLKQFVVTMSVEIHIL